ncbi:MAG: methylated-DNA--[protein]-cysteine S-methyltransferase [Candidatus Latescibacteria bacterium]|nr:methylated-DNA--[protein]-cysteine S-methyltransferase [Candidatus Latescibacterota bacterium]
MFDLQMLRKLPGKMVWDTVESPVGQLTVLASDKGVRAILYEGEMAEQVQVDLWRAEGHLVVDGAVRQLKGYFEGELRIFDLPLDLYGTDFQKRVWQLLLEIPFGKTQTYGDLAREMGGVGASQAVGAANGNNAVAIVVPCHRVIGASGDLTGYAGGMDKKEFLLRHEGVIQEQLVLF